MRCLSVSRFRLHTLCAAPRYFPLKNIANLVESISEITKKKMMILTISGVFHLRVMAVIFYFILGNKQLVAKIA